MGLGENKEKYLFTCRGWLPPAEMRRVLLQLIELIGMRKARSHPHDDYPYDDGEVVGGGDGFTLYQPLMESYAVVDVYYDSHESEVLVSTCKPERLAVDKVINFLSRKVGPTKGGKLKEE